jgi:hypothetical protein
VLERRLLRFDTARAFDFSAAKFFFTFRLQHGQAAAASVHDGPFGNYVELLPGLVPGCASIL